MEPGCECSAKNVHGGVIGSMRNVLGSAAELVLEAKGLSRGCGAERL